tara:strand:+ start:177 stop:434 length:258 start_codon:yes stop_codon:yes gene_type:complete
MIYGSYGFTLLCIYAVVSFVFYLNRKSQSRVMSLTLELKKGARGRKALSESVATANKEKKLALLWPVFLYQRLKLYVTKKLKKKE